MTGIRKNISGQQHDPRPFVPGSPIQKLYFRAKRWYRTCRSFLADPHYRTLARSGLFDVRYYLANDPGLDSRYIDPLIHYLEAGWREGRKPNPLFDSSWYRELQPQCAESDPLRHYIEQGWREGADPTPLFFTTWYAGQYPQSTRRGATPLRHYLRTGWQQGCRPNPFTDLGPYLEAHPELRGGGAHPLAHYVEQGFRDQAGPLPFFDADYYLEDNPAAAGLAMSPLAHYLQYGVREGRAPNRFFAGAYYLDHHPEAGPSELTAFLHFTSIGQAEGFRPNPLFDPAWYGRAYPDFAKTHTSGLLHYQEKGIFSGNFPCAEVADLPAKPVISVVTPVYNTDEALLRRCIHSVLFQAYPCWELCLADDGSDRPHVRQLLEEYAARDPRIKIHFLERNQGIAGASNGAAALAGGDYLAFLDHDDELTPDALYEVARAVNDHAADLLYSDEDLINLESRHLDSFFKPDYNPELLLTHNYITHLLVAGRELYSHSGGFSSEYEGAQDFDLVLKLSEKARRIVHIPKVLYHWRASATSTSVNHSQKTYADASGRKALEAALARREITATVEQGQWRFYYRVRRVLAETESVSLLVRLAEGESAARWYERIAGFLGHEVLDIHCLAAGDAPEGADNGFRHQVHCHGGCDLGGPAAQYNGIARQCRGRYLLFVAPGFVPDGRDWLHFLLEMAQDQAAGAVTGLLESSENQEGRPEITENMSWRQYRHFFLEGSRDLNNIYCEQNVLAVPVDLCLVRKDLFDLVGGFAEELFPQVMYDLDFSLKLREHGYANVYTPCCRGRLARDSGTTISDEAAAREMAAFRVKWSMVLKNGDPYYNPGKILADRKISREKWLQWYAGRPADAA
ncbi:MAG: glycosyltransferase family 2 protein [Desulfobulbaceae bacterium]